VHGELLITPQGEGRIARDNAPAREIDGDQLRASLPTRLFSGEKS
jgi:hypothetical protein